MTSLNSYENYQKGRGSNTAWTWEHQAITRARFCAGTPELGPRFEAVRRAVICADRDADALRNEIQAMRERVRSARPVKAGLFDVKHSEGAMMDAEFAVQYLVLAHGKTHPELLDNVGNIALLQRAEPATCCPRCGPRRGRCVPRASARAAQGAPGRKAHAGRPAAWRRSAMRCGLVARRLSLGLMPQRLGRNRGSRRSGAARAWPGA